MTMRNFLRPGFLFGCIACSLAAGCTYQTVPVSAPETVVNADPATVRDAHAALLAAFSDEEMTAEPRRIGAACGAHRFPVSAGPALRRSIESLLGSRYTAYRPVDFVPDGGAEALDFYLAVDIDRFETRLGYAPGIWTGSAHAETSVSIAVAVYDPNGVAVMETVVSGDGSSIAEGGCAAGSQALADATSEAIQESLEALSYRVLDSELVEALIAPEDSVAVADVATEAN